jgi:hypothetical protein
MGNLPPKVTRLRREVAEVAGQSGHENIRETTPCHFIYPRFPHAQQLQWQ